jgi:hypothetical protein
VAGAPAAGGVELFTVGGKKNILSFACRADSF